MNRVMVYSLMGLFLLALGCASTPTPKRGPLNPELVVDGVYEGSATIWPVKAVVQLFAAGVCALAAFYSFVFVHAEYFDGGRAFGHVPVWACEVIMPLAFAVMGLRYLMMSLMSFKAVFTPNTGK